MESLTPNDNLIKWAAFGTLAILFIVSMVFYWIDHKRKDKPIDKPVIDIDYPEFNNN